MSTARTIGSASGTGTRARGGDQPRRDLADPRRVRRVRRRIDEARRRVRQLARAGGSAITWTGWFVVACTVTATLAGLCFDWIEAWTVAVLGIALLLVAAPFLVGSRSYRTGIELSRASVVVGGEVRASVRVENTSSRPQLPAVAELPVGDALREVPIPLLGRRETAVLPVAVPTHRRGVIPVGPLTVARRDPLGLLRREVTWRERHLVHVRPRTARLPPNAAGLVRELEGTPSRRLTDADLSFHAVREYAPGDALRHVHWRSTAKTGALMVRQYEESQTARVAVLFDARPDEYGSPAEFELGVEVAASVSVQAVRESRERLVVSAWTPPGVRPGLRGLDELPSRDAARLLDAWAEIEPVGHGARLETLARALADAGRTLSVVTVVSGSAVGLARIRRVATAFSPGVGVLAVRCELLAEPEMHRFGSLRVCTVGALDDLPGLLALSRP